MTEFLNSLECSLKLGKKARSHALNCKNLNFFNLLKLSWKKLQNFSDRFFRTTKKIPDLMVYFHERGTLIINKTTFFCNLKNIYRINGGMGIAWTLNIEINTFDHSILLGKKNLNTFWIISSFLQNSDYVIFTGIY